MTQPGNAREAERETRNRGLEEQDRLLHESKRTPRTADEQDTPESERLTTPQEDADQDISQLENPPQAEGPRERSNNAV